jgi:hypothetical protein
MDYGLVTGFVRLDYKPQQITIASDNFFDSICSSSGSASSTAFA